MKKSLKLLLLAIPAAMMITSCGGGGDAPTSSGDQPTTGQSISAAPSTSETPAPTSSSSSQAHVHAPDEHGYCSCGEYQGQTYHPGEVSVTGALGQKVFFRVAVQAGTAYYPSADNTECMDNDWNAWVKSGSTWTSILMTPPPWSVSNENDGCMYFYLHFKTAGTMKLVLCTHSSLDEYGFCNECHQFGGHINYSMSEPVSLSGISSSHPKDYYAFYYTDQGSLLYSFMGTAEDAEHNGANVSLYYKGSDNQLHQIAVTKKSNQSLDIPHSQIASVDHMIYAVVNYTGSGSLSGSIAVGGVDFNGFDNITGYKRYHADTIAFGSEHQLVNEMCGHVGGMTYSYCFKAESPIANRCYHLTASFAMTGYSVFNLVGNEKQYISLSDGYFIAPNTSTLYFEIMANTQLSNAHHIQVDQGHFASSGDNYKGFYCGHHNQPVWVGEPDIVVGDDYTGTITVGAGQTKYFRFMIDAGHDLQLSTTDNSLYYSFYYYGFSSTYSDFRMLDLQETIGFVEDLPLSQIVADGEDPYIFMAIYNPTGSSRTIDNLRIDSLHHYNEAGVCVVDGEPIDEPELMTHFTVADVLNGTTHEDMNFPTDGKYLAIPVAAGHTFNIEFADGAAIVANEEAEFYTVSRVNYRYTAEPLAIYGVDATTLYGIMPTSEDQILYVYIEPDSPRSNVDVTVYYTEHTERTMGRCECGDFEGSNLTVGGLIFPTVINAHETAYFKFEFDPNESYSIMHSMQFDDTEFSAGYFTDEWEYVELSSSHWDYEGDSEPIIIHTNDLNPGETSECWYIYFSVRSGYSTDENFQIHVALVA